MKMCALTLACFLLVSNPSHAQDAFWSVKPTGSSVSLRGVAATKHTLTSEPIVWASGAKGTVLRTLDQGTTWLACGPKDFSELDFRSIHAWNEREAIIASAGTPALVLRTADSGQTWKQVVRSDDPKAFFDGLRFIDEKRGVLFGDPINGNFLVMTSVDGGHHWQTVPQDRLPKTRDKEAAFAASNSALLVAPPSSIFIGTGGTASANARVHRSLDFGITWDVTDCPIQSDESSGIFSLAVHPDNARLVAVGGDYRPEAKSNTTGALSTDNGATYRLCASPPTGYRSAIVFMPTAEARARGGFVACGPAGTDWSADGDHWTAIDTQGFHAMAVLPNGRVVAVGSDGRSGWSKSGL